jgi:hypothetical protein
VSKGEDALPGVGDGPPSSREAEGEDGEGFISPKAAGVPIYSYQRGGGVGHLGTKQCPRGTSHSVPRGLCSPRGFE